MSSCLHVIICVIIVIISVFFKQICELRERIITFEKPIVLAIGVLSARENFKQREIIRSTWLNNSLFNKSNSIKAWFILGNSSCSIPKEYRLSEYSCEKWNINISSIEEKIFTSSAKVSEICLPEKKKIIHQGFSFKVNHPIVVTKLGILSDALKPITKAKVAIMDVHSKEFIVQAMIFSNGSTIHGYDYATVQHTLFPKNYEGLILFEGYIQNTVCSSFSWNDGGGVITFKRIYSTSYHLDSKKYSSSTFSAVSMEFFVEEIDSLKNIVRKEATITKLWHQHLEDEQKKIDMERAQHKDLLILDSIDVYRNLPIKILKFYKWLQLNYKFLYVLKTDDDSIINIELLFKKLQENTQFNPNRLWLWSRFRKDWPLNYIGKWADHDYKSTYYPSFPCGAAYVLSQQTAAWLSANSDSLYIYQGEDVSIGIWLSAINPDFIEEEYFECDSSCNDNSYNRAQLEPNQIRAAWYFLKECNNLCSCRNISTV